MRRTSARAQRKRVSARYLRELADVYEAEADEEDHACEAEAEKEDIIRDGRIRRESR